MQKSQTQQRQEYEEITGFWKWLKSLPGIPSAAISADQCLQLIRIVSTSARDVYNAAPEQSLTRCLMTAALDYYTDKIAAMYRP